MTHFGVDGGVGSHINSKQRLTTVHEWKVMGCTLQWNGSRREMEAKVHTYVHIRYRYVCIMYVSIYIVCNTIAVHVCVRSIKVPLLWA